MSGDTPSVFDPAGPAAGPVTTLAWIIIVTATVVAVVVFAYLAVALRRRGRAVGERTGRRIVAIGGAAAPAAVLTALLGLTIATDGRVLSLGGPEPLRIDVVGHRYWWEVIYDGTPAITANEIHLPVGRAVRLTMTSDDVIHSLWVPQLGGKMDLIPGHTTALDLQADRIGSFRGQCAEFCGIAHAQMGLLVIVEERSAFDAWLAREGAFALEPGTPLARRGRDLFMANACVACHTIRGTQAVGPAGPDLTHVGARRTIGAARLANDWASLLRWIHDAPSVKPGSEMPPMPLADDELRAIVAYLRALR